MDETVASSGSAIVVWKWVWAVVWTGKAVGRCINHEKAALKIILVHASKWDYGLTKPALNLKFKYKIWAYDKSFACIAPIASLDADGNSSFQWPDD
jgi:hypothetical protein